MTMSVTAKTGVAVVVPPHCESDTGQFLTCKSTCMKAIIALHKAENLLFFDFNLHGENSAVYDPFCNVVSGTFKAKIKILYEIKQQLNPMVPVKIVHSK